MRPDCKECNKQLAKYTWLMTHMGQGLTDDQVEEMARKRYGSDYHGITSIRRFPAGTTLPGAEVTVGEHTWAHVWQGTYGYAGNGHFCSKECGFRWAVSKARREARDQEQYSRIISRGEV
jgi:hypothetical protein